MRDETNLHIETLTIHGGQSPEPTTGAVMPPIFQTSTYAQRAPGEHKGYEYSRTDNPTRHKLEANLASLDGARYGLAFASGMAAITTIMMLLREGDHVVAMDDLYGGTVRLFEQVLRQFGLDFTYVDMTNPDNLDGALQPNTRIVWVETPTNPLLKIVDLAAVTAKAHAAGALVVCDNTFLSPYFQRPLEFGVDMVLYSTTKYLNGHSDVVGGAIVTNHEDLFQRLKFLQNAVGAVPGPMDCWLTLRGIKTLHVRMDRHQANAMRIAEWLEAHPKVRRVYYPGLPSHPQHELAARQQRGFGGMVTALLDTDLEGTRRFLSAVRLFTLAESLGGVESLIEHPAIMTHASLPPERRAALGIGDSLVRLSIGIEHVDDLIADLEQALATI
ncbi:MAG: cystathionine gamma-synthase [Ardenticatenia bacterium]|nr:MAG: cystathionine gamma-synthase [Ardenticatenia bacterium]